MRKLLNTEGVSWAHDRLTSLGDVAVFNSMAPDNYNNNNSKYFADTHVEQLRRQCTMETGVLQLQVRSCGTAFQLICDKPTLAFNDLSGY